MATAAVGTHIGGGALSLMSCVRESSPHESISDYDSEKNATSKKKFWNPRKWFKRKSNKIAEEHKPELPEPVVIKEPVRSRSASELSETDEPVKRRSGTPMHPGLSVSHDSIFHSPHSGSELELEEVQSSSSLSIQHHPTQKELRLQTELSERLRTRRGHGDTSEDDEGLPRSPCCNSPTTMDGLNEKTPIKNHATKSHSTCSDGSLLSMGSSDIEEDSYGQHSSQHSSKVSLQEKKPPLDQESDWEFGTTSISTPLNHSAAHHRVSVRPKRTHGAPRRKHMSPVSTSSALPTTPEVNEDISLRSNTPEVSKKETMTELYNSVSMSETKTETQLKCSSLPPGIAGPTTEIGKLNRSRSTAGSKSQDALCEEDEDKGDKKTDNSIFARLFTRRSAKKKKSLEENITASCSILSYTKHTVETNSPTPINKKSAIKSGPASRQRMTPLDIPVTPELIHKRLETVSDKLIPSVQLDLDTTVMPFRTVSATTHSNIDQQSVLFMSPATAWSENSKLVTNSFESRMEQVEVKEEKISKYESKSKIKIAGLSSLQQRVLLHNDDVVDNTFTSLTDFGRDDQMITCITKSHSFRANSNNTVISNNDFIVDNKTEISNIFKSASLDSIKVLDDIKDLSIVSDSTESLNSESSVKTSCTEFLDSLNPCTSITISGPSHTSVVSVSSTGDSQVIKPESSVANAVKDSEDVKDQVSITTIQLKRDLNPSIKNLPEFLNVQLNKLESKPTSIVLTTPSKLGLETTVFNFETPKSPSRKFSQDDIEVVEKETNEEIVEIPCKNITSANVILTSMTPPVSARIFKKNSEVTVQARKSSLVLASESKTKISLRTKSSSLDSDISQTNFEKPEIKQKTISTIDLKEDVIMRRKSLMKQKHDDEPELMKVFARRSLKVKDSDEIAQQVLSMIDDANAATQDSDKENIVDHSNSITKEIEKPKELIVENKYIETTEVTLRKPVNNKFIAFQQRTASLNIPKVNDIINIEKSQKIIFNDRPKTQIGSKINDLDTKVINLDISAKSDFINEDFPTIPKNFNQRKAEWEKRAQEALKKTVP